MYNNYNDLFFRQIVTNQVHVSVPSSLRLLYPKSSKRSANHLQLQQYPQLLRYLSLNCLQYNFILLLHVPLACMSLHPHRYCLCICWYKFALFVRQNAQVFTSALVATIRFIQPVAILSTGWKDTDVLCVTCWIDYWQTNIRQGRLKAKRGQNKQIQRMVKHSNKRIRLAEAGENVLILIPTLDRISPFDPRNLPGMILEIRDDGMHRIGTAAGVLDAMHMVSQFQPSISKFITPEDVPDKQVSLREAILHSSFGKHRLQCNCTGGCNSNTCKCRKSCRICNSKCHKSLACHNKTVVQSSPR